MNLVLFSIEHEERGGESIDIHMVVHVPGEGMTKEVLETVKLALHNGHMLSVFPDGTMKELTARVSVPLERND